MSQAPLPAAYFSNLLPELATRAARATVSRLGFSNPALRQYLNRLAGQAEIVGVDIDAADTPLVQ